MDIILSQLLYFAKNNDITLDQAIAITQIDNANQIVERLNFIADSVDEINKTIGSAKDVMINNSEILSGAISDVVAELNRVDRSLGLKR